MQHGTLNLGILAHVDAGKTTLTERLLYAAGVIDAVGSVDRGTTQTDSLALERERGITIKAAVVSFELDGLTVNLIDTPGHPDFIAEVERSLGVLDGAVLVVSAVEGVQAQTRLLMRALRRLGVPTLVFVNKIDRRGADPERVLRELSERLTPAVVPMGSVRSAGTREAEFAAAGPDDASFASSLALALAERDDELLAAWVEDETRVPYDRLRAALAGQSRRALVHPVFFGSALTGAGVAELGAGISELLPAAGNDVDGPASGVVFKLERGPNGEKVAYVRMFSGTVRTRDRLPSGDGAKGKVTAIAVLERGAAVRRAAVSAGRVAKVWGLGDVRVGDAVGAPPPLQARHHFGRPTLETVVVPADRAEGGAVRAALVRLAEEDPLIDVRQDDDRRELAISLYGEVQKEVVEATLANDFGLHVEFRETTPICIERVVGIGRAVERLGEGENPFLATVGLEVAPAPVGAGVSLHVDVALESMPLYVYKAVEHFRTALEDHVRETLRQGLSGWEVPDCAVTLIDSGYAAPATTAKDFRLLTPLVLMDALRRARTVVCEPIHRFHLELPADAVGAASPLLARVGAAPRKSWLRRSTAQLEGDVPAAQVHSLHRELRSLGRGEAVLESSLDHYRPLRGAAPTRPRLDDNPLNRKEYVLRVTRRRVIRDEARAGV